VTRQRFGSFIPAMLVVGSCTLTTLATAADPHAAAVIQVTDTVVATGIEPVGANLTTIAGGTNFAVNNFIWGGGFEPGVARYLIRVERSGPNWIEWDESEGGIHMWGSERHRLRQWRDHPLLPPGGQCRPAADVHRRAAERRRRRPRRLPG
jgi:hypothetical protein